MPAVASLVREDDIITLRTRCDSISEGGIGARGHGLEPMRVGDLVTMELHIPVSIHPIWVDTIVRYVVARGRAGRCGLEFLSLSENQRSIISHYCRLQPMIKR